MTRRSAPPPPPPGSMDLFGDWEVPDAPVAPPDPLWGALDVTWHRPPAGRHLCQDCVALIHGRPDGPQPRVATSRRRGPNDDLLLCAAHAQIRRDEDERVKRVHADRIAANRAAQKAVLAGKGYGPRREHA